MGMLSLSRRARRGQAALRQARTDRWAWRPGRIADSQLRRAMRRALVYYPFWEGAGTARDYAGGRVSTLTGGAAWMRTRPWAR